jgi:hypothetical protein
MLNYFVKFEDEIYKVIDGNTSRVVASFINEVDAHMFLRSLITNVQGQQGGGMPMMYPPMVPPMMGYVPQTLGTQFHGMGIPSGQNPLYSDPNLNAKLGLDSLFDDSTIQMDDSEFVDDKLGTLLKLPPEVYAGSFDDSSLGETSAYRIHDIENINFLKNSGKKIGKK